MLTCSQDVVNMSRMRTCSGLFAMYLVYRGGVPSVTSPSAECSKLGMSKRACRSATFRGAHTQGRLAGIDSYGLFRDLYVELWLLRVRIIVYDERKFITTATSAQ
jgi:hypothetical protein